MKADLFFALGVFAWMSNATQAQRAYGRVDASKPRLPHVSARPIRHQTEVFQC